MARMAGLAALLLLALVTAPRGAAAAKVAAPRVPLSSSVMVFGNQDLAHPSPAAARCPQLLERAASHGSRAVNIVLTQYWVDERFKSLPKTCNPDAWAEPSRVDHYCQYWEYADGCRPWTDAATANVTAGLKYCLAKAFDLFDEVLISPHLDDGTRTGHWRNMLVFDPLAKDSNGYSYEDVMIAPLVAAAKEALGKRRAAAGSSNGGGAKSGGASAKKTLWFGLQGEMGATVFHHPESYIELARRVRAALGGVTGDGGGNGAGAGAALKVGVLLNHGYLPGVVNRGPDTSGPPPAPASAAMGPLSGGWGPVLPLEQWARGERVRAALPAARELLTQHIDFLGISNYARAPADVEAKDMESAVAKFDAELTAMGVPLREITVKHSVKFIYNEVAVGGGASECGDVTAATAEQIGRFPWLGRFTYTKQGDPWKAAAGRAYMRRWYGALLGVLARGGLRYPVHGAFVWNCASWDVQGVYSAEYTEPGVVALVRRHNAAVAKGRAAAGAAAGAGAAQ